MKIEQIDIYQLELPFIKPFKTAATTHFVRGTVLVRLMSNGVSGWGESSPGKYPHYSSEYADGAFSVCQDVLSPLILGKTIHNGGELAQCMAAVKGNCFAKSAFDHALWDLSARTLGKTLTQHVGYQATDIVAGSDFGVEGSISTLIGLIEKEVDAGSPRVKLKCCPEWDIDPVRAVREAFPHLPIHIDCNSGYRIKDINLFKELDRYNLSMIEQPLQNDDLIDHAQLQSELKTPICLDESITSPIKARQAASIGACRWINIKPPRVGGLTNALEILSICKESKIKTWVGSMFETSIGQAPCIALARAGANDYPMDLLDTNKLYGIDLGQGISVARGGQTSIPNKIGIGFEPCIEKVNSLCIGKVSFIS